jgi:protein-tyrosine phosphatase
MNIDSYRIFENLYQGSIPPGGRIVSDAGFDVLVLCAWENQDPSHYEGLEVILAPGEDIKDSINDPQELETWKVAATTVYERLKEGKRVLVTCIGGYNRSGMVTAMAMHHVLGWSGTDIVDHIRRKRTGALHNRAFARWLVDNLKGPDNELP